MNDNTAYHMISNLPCSVIPKNYQHVLALVFAVKEINENPEVLPNVTLGFHIYDSYFIKRMTYWAILQLLSTWDRFLPNYKCNVQKNLLAVIGGLNFETSLSMATVLDIYKIPQITYGSFAPVEGDQTQSTLFYRMIPNEDCQSTGIIDILLHFGWTWAGFLAADNDSAERFMQKLQPLLTQRGICFAFSERTKSVYFENYYDMITMWLQIYQVILRSKANVVVVFGETSVMFALRALLAVDCNMDGEMTDPCTGREKLNSVPSSSFEITMTGHSYSVYNAVYAVANALHALYRSMSKSKLTGLVKGGRLDLQNLQPWQLCCID
ncbi:hypothetical protein JD844_001769 [Phrynosoma platyrhinos]|uniref:Receptor ligand binding region domain-containing protein n=1 Tax=Phrynosoma platyrhinos TaxID=52577 RepID=A0ABQ7TAH7_PHRPL|nr:hypothetical protein JD844_001769 [Phrynosoma platyrhinos]